MDSLGIVLIEWRDAQSSPGWHGADELQRGLAAIKSVGWLVSESEESVTLAISVGTHAAGDLLSIPKSCIVREWALTDRPDQDGKSD